MEPTRVSPTDIYQNVKSGKTLLVCGYDDNQKFQMIRLEGSIPLSDFRSRLATLSKSQDVVFYCAWTKEATAARVAAEYIQKGYTNIRVLGGGVEAWRKAGYPVFSTS